ncbi:unnamed protein product [Clonostachys solani]|uniref:Uncharacterized protein n=1 Tax=Clonostachys solani TaxID=160281 RepID=A0A9N9ZH09_9HYPO|nr:unnamed protein product [Clonostachys solani]
MDWEEYPTIQFEGQLVDGDFSTVAANDDTDADQHIDITEQWEPLTDLILKTTKDAWDESPYFDASSPNVFQSYWQRVFSELHASVVADKNIPEYVTEPPVKGFDVDVFDQHPNCCPCDLPSAPQNIKIFRPDGVTKGDFIKAVGTYLYGDSPPRVYSLEHGKPIQPTGVMVYHINWMSQRSSTGGNAAFPCYFARGHQIVSVVLYCCPKGDFFKNKGQVEAEKEERRKRGEERRMQREEKEKASEVDQKETEDLRNELHERKKEERLGRKRQEKLRDTSRAAERRFVNADA